MTGPRVRTDIVEVYVFRRDGEDVEFLQARRVEPPAQGTWQPVFGHVGAGETATACALRETAEETGLSSASDAFLNAWALERVRPFLLADRDEVVLSPRFAIEVSHGWTPTLDDEHDAWRWVRAGEAHERFLWPSQRASIGEVLESILPGGETADRLRIDPSAF